MMRAFIVALFILGTACSSPGDGVVEQALSSTISTSAPSYAPGSSITVSWADLPGNPHDWVALAPAGSDTTTVTRWVYTAGAATGMTTFPGLVSGNYVARAFLDDSYTLIAEAAFAVTGTTVTTDHPAYATGPIVVSWSGLPGTSTDWIGIAPSGSPATTVTSWIYTGGAASGSHAFAAPAPGTYVARAFPEDSYALAGESPAFEVGTQLATNASYAVNEPITVTWDHLSSNAKDWIALAPAGSAATSVISWVYTGGASAGSHTFGGLATGNYVARAFLDDTYTLLVESAPFVVGGTPPPGGAITIQHPAYGWGQDITITWSGFPTNATDWIALAPAGSPDTVTARWFYTGGQAAGSYTFVDGLPATTLGGFVARGFANNTSTKIAQSTPFTLQDDCVQFTSLPASVTILTVAQAAQYKDQRTLASLAFRAETSGNEYTLPCVESVGGDLTIQPFDEFNYRHIVGVHLPRLKTVGGKVGVTDVERLSLPRLQSIGGTLDVRGTTLADLTAFSSLTSAGALLIAGSFLQNVVQPGVDSLHGLEGLTTIPGNVFVAVDGGLADLTGLDNLASIGGYLTVYFVASLHGLDALTTVGGDVYFDAIDYDTGVGSLATVGGDLELRATQNPPEPQDITGFTSLVSVGGALWLYDPGHVVFPVLQSAYDFYAYGSYTTRWVEFRAPMLTTVVDHFVVINHLALPDCQVYAVFNALNPPPMHPQLGNLGPCPP